MLSDNFSLSQSYFLLLDRGLKNDTTKETFHLRHCLSGRLFPCNFVKIVPILSWGPSFNFSIWHVALAGDDSDETVHPAVAWHNEVRSLVSEITALLMISCSNRF
jgi:hypothetical protein